MNKNHGEVFHFSIIIDNPIHIIYGTRTWTLFMIQNFYLISRCSLFQHISFRLFLFLFFIPFHGWILPIFTSRIYIYNIYHCQGWISYYLDSKKKKEIQTCKTRIGLRHTYERVYNNDVFGCIWQIKYHDNEPF